MALSTTTTRAEPAERASWRPLIAWGLASLYFGYAFVHRVSPSVMVAELMRDFAVGGAILGNLSAFYFYAYASLQIPVGLLMDRIGPRRLLAGAALVSAAGSLLFATSDVLAVAYLGRLMIGAGLAFSWVGVLTIAAQWFPPTRFAFLAGIAQAVGMAGGVFGQAPLALAVESIGWRGALIIVGVMGLVLGALMWLVVRDRPHEATKSVSILASLGTLLKNRETWLNAVFGLSTAGPMLGFGGLWAVPYLATVYGLERPTAAAFTSLMFIGWGIGSPLIGMLSDRLRRRKLLMVTGAVCATLTLAAIVYLPGLPLFVLSALMVAHGATASAMVLSFACVREHNPPGMSSTAMGIVNVAVVGSGALFQPLIGLLLDLNWDGTLVDGARVYAPAAYQLGLSALVIGCLFGLAASLAMRETYGRQRSA